jgi:hypothetical protein
MSDDEKQFVRMTVRGILAFIVLILVLGILLLDYGGVINLCIFPPETENYSKQKQKQQLQQQSMKARQLIKDKFARMNNEIKRLKKEKTAISEKFTKLAECPGVKERYCTCKGKECTCGNEAKQGEPFVRREDYAPIGGSIPVRPEQNMVAGAVGKAKQLKAEAALRGAAMGLPMPKGPMLGKEPILTLDGTIEAFRPNRGRF